MGPARYGPPQGSVLEPSYRLYNTSISALPLVEHNLSAISSHNAAYADRIIGQPHFTLTAIMHFWWWARGVERSPSSAAP